jgi:hypothetical protein
MISNALRIIAAIILATGVLLGVVELWWLIVSGITALRMSLFAKKNSLLYRPGIGSFFVTKPFELISLNGIELTIMVDINPNRRFWPSNLRLLMRLNNPGKMSLWIRNRGFLETPQNYFYNAWDKKLWVQSKPALLGRTIFQSSDLLRDTVWLLSNIHPSRKNQIKLLPSGRLEISILNKGFNAQRAKTLIRLASNISDRVES